MAFQNINLQTPIVERRPDGSTVTYQLQWDRSTQEVRAIEATVNGQPTQNSNPNVIFGPASGNWNTSRISDPQFNTALQDTYKQQIAAAVNQAATVTKNKRGGGSTRTTGTVPSWVTQTLNNPTAGAPAATGTGTGTGMGTPAAPPAAPPGGGGLTNLSTLSNLAGAVTNPLGTITGLAVNFATANETAASATPLIYPENSSGNGMDRLVIQCYTYQPPYQAALLTASNDRGSGALATGAQRGSPLKEPVGGPIFLPMPQSIRDSATAAWDVDTMNNISMAASGMVSSEMMQYLMGIYGGNLGGNLLGVQNAGQNLAAIITQLRLLGQASSGAGKAGVSAAVLSGVLGKLGYDVSPETLLARGAGVIANSNQELLFKGPAMRTFSFTYQLTPRSITEAVICRKIIRRFKEFSAAKKLTADGGADAFGGTSFFLGTPNIWELKYTTAENRGIRGMHLFKPCALTRFETDYAPNNHWMADVDGNPMSYRMSLDFSELEPIYNTDYNTGSAPGFDDGGRRASTLGGININDQDTIGY